MENKQLVFNNDEAHSLLQIIDFWDSQHRNGTEVGAKVYKFFGYDVEFNNQRDKHWWVTKGDFKSLPFKATNGSVCSDSETLEDAIKRAENSNKQEGLEQRKIKIKQL